MNNFEFALKMEENGEEYYRKQAEENKDNALYNVFIMMAEDEAKHAKILLKKFKEEEYELTDNGTLDKSFNVIKEQEEIFKDFADIPKQLNAYKAALENERQSAELYKKLFDESEDDESKELFEFLIKEEMDHHNILEELVLELNKPDEWVESAEFGVRPEY